MATYLIQGETLTAVADKLRDYLNLTGKTFSEDVANNTDVIKFITNDQAVEIIYREFVDDQINQYPDDLDRTSKVIRGWGYQTNQNNEIVPVLYTTDGNDIYAPYPDLEEPLYYIGTATINGVTYDKWRKIDPVYSWEEPAKIYYYTTRVVNTTSTSTLLSPTSFSNKIDEVYEIGQSSGGSSGGVDTSDATATDAHILSGKTAYTASGKTTGTMAFQEAITITPGTTNKTAISSGYYASGSAIVKGDANLVAGNIKSGVSIFGVSGTYAGTADRTGEISIIEGTISGRYFNSSVTYVKSYAFYNCINLKDIQISACSRVGSAAFAMCYSLSVANLSKCTLVDMSAFASCYLLNNVYLPICTKISTQAFYLCSSLATIELPKVTTIGTNAFQGCKRLSDITIGTSNCVLSNSNAFGNTSITSSTGTIRVPAAYVSAYKTATNWSYFSNRIYIGG